MYTIKYPRCREPPHQQLWDQLKYATYTRETKKGVGLDNRENKKDMRQAQKFPCHYDDVNMVGSLNTRSN